MDTVIAAASAAVGQRYLLVWFGAVGIDDSQPQDISHKHKRKGLLGLRACYLITVLSLIIRLHQPQSWQGHTQSDRWSIVLYNNNNCFR